MYNSFRCEDLGISFHPPVWTIFRYAFPHRHLLTVLTFSSGSGLKLSVDIFAFYLMFILFYGFSYLEAAVLITYLGAWFEEQKKR